MKILITVAIALLVIAGVAMVNLHIRIAKIEETLAGQYSRISEIEETLEGKIVPLGE